MYLSSGIKLLTTWISILTLFILLIIISINHSSIIYSESYYNKNLQTIDARIDDYVNSYFETVENLSQDVLIIQSLNPDISLIKIEEELNSINNALRASIVYVLNTDGQVVISSDYLENTSLKGNNYAFRPYFTEALKGENHVMMAIGVTTGLRGIYFSSPIKKDYEIIGVMVIKVDLERIDRIIYNNSIYTDIVSDDGIIFSSTNKDWILENSTVTDNIESINVFTTGIIKDNWKLRMIYREEDLQKTPILYLMLIFIMGSLLFTMLSITVLLYHINQQKKLAEIRLVDRKREIIRINANLEEKIKERTAQLKFTQKQLVEAEKMAALGNLVAGVSHEINTPVGVSLTASTYLKTQIDDLLNGNLKLTRKNLGSLKETSMMIIKNIQKSSEIIRTFKQVTGETIVEDPQLLNMRDHIEETIRSVGIYNNGIKTNVVINCSEDIKFTTYPMAFYHIFNNLVNNTIKHAFSGNENEKIEITINKTEDQLLIIYQDNGSGMDEETCSKIFEPFFTTKRGQGGTGLGMHIVYNIIVKLFKGDIHCQSKKGKGTSFTMYFSPIK